MNTTNTYKLSQQDFLIEECFSSLHTLSDTGNKDYTVGEKKYTLRIKDMPSEDKPREKMIKYGPSALSVAELIAVLLNTGTVKEDVLSMSSRIIKDYGERSLGEQKDAEALARDLDIPLAKAVQIVACAELGRRFFEKRLHGPQTIRTAKDVFEYLPEMRLLPKEHLRGLYLNTHHRIVHDEVISIGTIDANIVHPREVFKPAIEYGAAGVVLVHNHPSGIVTPSQADIEITQHIISVGKIIGIPLIDHVIVGKDSFMSIETDY